jgi:hypothetical protein
VFEGEVVWEGRGPMKVKDFFTYGTLYLLVLCITHCSNAKGS